MSKRSYRLLGLALCISSGILSLLLLKAWLDADLVIKLWVTIGIVVTVWIGALLRIVFTQTAGK